MCVCRSCQQTAFAIVALPTSLPNFRNDGEERDVFVNYAQPRVAVVMKELDAACSLQFAVNEIPRRARTLPSPSRTRIMALVACSEDERGEERENLVRRLIRSLFLASARARVFPGKCCAVSELCPG